MKDKIPDDAVKNTSCDDGAAMDGSGLETTVDSLYLVISEIVEDARKTVYRATNQAMVKAYWEIGRVIVEEEQAGKRRAEYGRALIAGISARLTQNFGRGFSRRNLADMRRFFLEFENLQTVSAKSLIPQTLSAELSWSHYCLLMRIKNKNAREFYIIECSKNNWSTRELDRQISSLLFERLSLSRDKEKVLELSREGQIVASAEDLIKDPSILEFLGMSESPDFHEKTLSRTSSTGCSHSCLSSAGALRSSRARSG
ncbi:MAG: DUF1016 N-terminal domain-containing protein [Thermoleophilia bacterium]|jgi:hypothetical protein